ncbi:MAG: membrane-associated HD superfamily phosphohydrolase, partial [Patiriisocius sp.]
MKKLLGSIFRNQSIIYKVFLFLVSTFLIIYLFPKGGQFKYNFQKGKPWQYENLYAPFSFTIKKDAEALDEEKQEARNNAIPYFDLDVNVLGKVKNDFSRLLTETYVDSLYKVTLRDIKKSGNDILNDLYKNGITDQIYPYDSEKIVYLKNGNEIEELSFKQMMKKEDLRFSSLIGNEDSESRSSVLLEKILQRVIKANVAFNSILTENELTIIIESINPNRGIIEKGGRIIAKGEVVEGDTYQILN